MSSNFLLLSVGSLLVMWFVDFFLKWYAQFLKRWMPHVKIRVLLGNLVWAMLAILFWFTLNNHLHTGTSYFFFVLFIYSVKGLIDSLLSKEAESSASN